MDPAATTVILLDAAAVATQSARTAVITADGTRGPCAELIPLALGDAAAARTAPWQLAAAALEAVIGPAWRLLPLPDVYDAAQWRVLRRSVVADTAQRVQRLTDLLTAGAVICGLRDGRQPLHAAEPFAPPAVVDAPYTVPLRPSSRQLQIDWGHALVQMTVDLSVGCAPQTTYARFAAALSDALITAAQSVADASAGSQWQIVATASLAAWADALQARLQPSGQPVAVQILPPAAHPAADAQAS